MKRLIRISLPLLSGLLFGVGLLLSGMTDPNKVLGFLDVFGHWDPALALVMGGAVAVTVPAFAYARHRGRTVFDLDLSLPDRSTLTPELLTGSALFGLGWGLSGACPGPALMIAAGGGWKGPLFVASMIGGMLLHEWLSRRAAAGPARGATTGVTDCG